MGKLVVSGHAAVWILGPPLVLAALVAGSSCSSTPPPTGLAVGCAIASDCSDDLVCAYGRCHEACKTSKDCNGASCLPPNEVCELPQETMCSGTLPCVIGLTCADDICRAPCMPGSANGTTGGCLGTQACVAVSNSPTEFVCVDASGDGGVASGDGGVRDSSSPDAHSRTPDAHSDGASDATLSDANGDSSEGSGTDTSTLGRNPDAGSLGFTASNVDLGSIEAGAVMGQPSSGRAPSDPDAGPFTNAPDVTVTGSESFSAPSLTITLSNGNFADLYVWSSLTLPDTASLSFTDTNPVILAVLTTVSIQGTIYVNDGNAGGFSVVAPGPGVGQGGNGFASSSGGGGGSFCGVGGQGGISTPPVPTGGPSYGTAKLIPLVGGSNGGASGAGAGGGAIQIVAGQSITVGPYARIQAGGQGGYPWGGGGSGGAILLEAPTVVIEGTLAANGGGGSGNNGDYRAADGNPSAQPAPGALDTTVDGGTASGGNGSAGTTVNGGNGGPPDLGVYGGGGGGGAGRIRINTPTADASISTAAVISPTPGTGCMTQGTLNP